MSNELPQIRANLARVGASIRQGNLLSAAQALRKGVYALTSKNLMRNEIEELQSLVHQAGGFLGDSSEVKTLFPLSLEYPKGDEAGYLDTIDALIDCLQNEASQAGILMAEEMNRKKTAGLSKGKQEVQEGRYDDAHSTFGELKAEFTNDSTLINDMAQIFMDANLNDQAIGYLEEVLTFAPENVHTLNKLAVTLRKLKIYGESEKNFQKALALDDSDPYLYFNFGRLYLDWNKFDQGLTLAERACELAPDFAEATKMRNYFKKQLKQP